MKRSKSGAQKRKEAATARDAVAKLPKMTDFFKITEQSRPGTSTERDEENYSAQEKELTMTISIKVIVNFQKM